MSSQCDVMLTVLWCPAFVVDPVRYKVKQHYRKTAAVLQPGPEQYSTNSADSALLPEVGDRGYQLPMWAIRHPLSCVY